VYVLLFIAHPHIVCKGEMQEKGPEPRKDGPLWFTLPHFRSTVCIWCTVYILDLTCLVLPSTVVWITCKGVLKVTVWKLYSDHR